MKVNTQLYVYILHVCLNMFLYVYYTCCLHKHIYIYVPIFIYDNYMDSEKT